MEKTIVLVTGVSTGLGRAFAKALLEAVYVVVGTVRRQGAVQEFESIEAERAFARVLDVTNGKRVVEVVGLRSAHVALPSSPTQLTRFNANYY